MTAIKKSSTKPAKSPAPATKPASSGKPAAAKKKTDAGAPVVAFPSSVAKVKTVATKPFATTITAKVDVGYGNALYIRGEGPGLRWDQGTLMTCVGDDAWAISLGESARPLIFKFLINDSTWSAGPDFMVTSGQSSTFSPGF